MSKQFENKTVIISGGLGDIGSSIAREFAKEGASIALGDLSPAIKAESFLKELAHYNVPTHYSTVDVTDPIAVQGWVELVEKKLGTPEIIIANAATVTLGGINDLSPAQWAQEINVNLNGAFYLSQSATGRLLANKKPGRVIFIGSWAAHAVHSTLPAYSVSKAGLRMLCQCMALELAPAGILVNELAPGYVEAGLSAKIWEENPGQREEAEKKVPVRKLISSEAVAWQVLRLCHPKNEHITGSTILMDGGLSLLR